MRTGKWLLGQKLDLPILFIPVWICWIIAFLIPENQLQSELRLWVWVVVVIGIDVGHVWGSIFRTYLDKEEFNAHRQMLVIAPILSFVLAFGLATVSVDLFWRCLAYVAVYHFVKQQFGFMRIYKAKNADFRKKLIRDNFVIYLTMLYPVLFWHLSADRSFAWFDEGDFLSANLNIEIMSDIGILGNGIYFFILIWWFLEEISQTTKTNDLQLGKILWVLTTAINWFLGIIYFNSDLVFTITNVVAHGLPYLALIIFYQGGKSRIKFGKISRLKWIKITGSIALVVLLLAGVEEYLWDLLVYQENETFFSNILSYPISQPSHFVQMLAIGILAVPQITHYILDGFIWKNNQKNPHLKKILLK